MKKMKKLISWFEIPATDFDRAVNFYEKVLDVNIEKFDWGTEKMGCFPNNGQNTSGSISYAPNFKPSENGVLISFNAGDDLNPVLQRVEKLGGKTVTPKTKIEAEGFGYFAIFIDSEGNKVGLYSDN